MTAHFTSADTIVPRTENIKAYDRYAYVFNNPLKYTDPSGHEPCGTAPEPWRSICLTNLGRSDQIEKPKQKTTDWFIVCGINYACTGDQTGAHKVFGLPAYPGWKQTIEATGGNSVTFIPVPEPQSNYSVSAYVADVTAAIQASKADEINLICHSRGGQVCTHLANTIEDFRIKTYFLLDPSFRLDEDKRDNLYDTISDYQTAVNNENKKFEIVLIVTHAQYVPSGSSGVTTYSFSFGTNDDHNKMIFEPGDISQVLKAILNHAFK